MPQPPAYLIDAQNGPAQGVHHGWKRGPQCEAEGRVMESSTAQSVATKGRSGSRLHRFARQEDGVMIIFALFLFVMMVMMGGLAVDLMRYESTRTSLQQAIDRCTLSAASLTQRLDPTTVVNDCMARADKAQYLTGVTVNEGLNYREVTARATADTNPFFLHMMGVNQLEAPGNSKAEQRITNVEIALVLDISGSMQNTPTRITNLKSAASEFVDSVLMNDLNNRISISIVPYNGQVNLGPLLRAKYNATDNPNAANVNCIDLPSSVYGSTVMSRTLAMPMTGHVDTFSSTDTSNEYTSYTNSSYGAINASNVWCPGRSENIVRLPNNNRATLKAQINALTAVGATSINAGMKWGVTMLDPASRPMFSEFVTAGQIPAAFSGRPFDYDDEEVMKVIVLMTDGEHFAEERLNDGYRSGYSPIYRSSNDGNLSIHHPNGNGTRSAKYWVPHRSEWRSAPWSNSNNNGTYVQQTWPQVWAQARVSWVSWQMYARALGTSNSTRSSLYSAWINTFRAQTPIGNMDTQLQQICSQAKANDIVVFGIAFEAPDGGQTQIRQCSTSNSHYFDASVTSITTVFRAIASQISYLRLTQ
jgi:Flp pilus assembly protein TadG